MEIVKIKGEVLIAKRFWWQLYKKNWHKHNDIFGNMLWIKFNWEKDTDYKLKTSQTRNT